MAYQLSDLITEVQRKVKDSTFDSALITDYLNDTQNEVLGSRMYSFMEAIESTTLNETDTSYTYPTDLQSVLLARVIDPSNDTLYFDVDYLPYREFYDIYPTPEAYDASTPTAYTDFGCKLYWDRPLGDDYDFKLWYLKRPTQMSDASDVPSIPEEFKDILIRGALASVEEYRDNYDMAGVHRRKVEDLVENMTIRYTHRNLGKVHKSTSARIQR